MVEERTAGVYLKHPTPTRLGSGKAICKDRTSKQAGMLAQRLKQVLGDWSLANQEHAAREQLIHLSEL